MSGKEESHMDYKTINANTTAVKPLGLIDYVNDDGLLVRDATLRVVMVRDENDLPDRSEELV